MNISANEWNSLIEKEESKPRQLDPHQFAIMYINKLNKATTCREVYNIYKGLIHDASAYYGLFDRHSARIARRHVMDMHGVAILNSLILLGDSRKD